MDQSMTTELITSLGVVQVSFEEWLLMHELDSETPSSVFFDAESEDMVAGVKLFMQDRDHVAMKEGG